MESLSPLDIAALKREISSSMHCAMPGIVESFDAAAGTAVIQPGLKRGGVAMPLLRDVPVYLPGGRTIQAGDLALVIFADCDIDAWLASGEVEEPASDRTHSLSDAFAFVGFTRLTQEGEN